MKEEDGTDSVYRVIVIGEERQELDRLGDGKNSKVIGYFTDGSEACKFANMVIDLKMLKDQCEKPKEVRIQHFTTPQICMGAFDFIPPYDIKEFLNGIDDSYIPYNEDGNPAKRLYL